MDSCYINCPTFVIMAERQLFKLITSRGTPVIWKFERQLLFWQDSFFFFFKEQKIYFKMYPFTAQLKKEWGMIFRVCFWNQGIVS